MLYADASQLCEILERMREDATTEKTVEFDSAQDRLLSSMDDAAGLIAREAGVEYRTAEFEEAFGGLLVGFYSSEDGQEIPEVLKGIDDEGWEDQPA